MAVNKVVINQDGVENVLIDITDSTVTPEKLAEGETAYDKSGEKITGTMSPGLDTSDATATADDIVMPKTAYVNGERVIGQLPYLGSIASKEAALGQAEIDGEKYINLWAEASERGLIEVGDIADLYAPLTVFGDVKSTDVMRGKTYTSSEGIRLYGTGGEMNTTLECNRPPWSNGGESVGSVNAIVNNENGLILPKTALMTVTFPLESLGNATPEDVLAGKVFSSADGIKCVGTFESGPGEIEVTDDGNGNLTILNAVVTDNNGAIIVTM